MTTNHNYYLDLAFQLAERNLGQTGLNPSVGSIVVKNNSVISSGVTSVNGRPHSEFNALEKIKDSFEATLYTTLEPCTHYGKTPPCVNIILKKKIKNVFYAFEDPDIKTYKKAKKILNAKGVKTKLIKTIKYKKFYKSYFINKKYNIPFISAKIAISKDYLTVNKKDKWITNNESRKTVHLLRSKNDGIISTSKSVNCDNSLLNCRIEGLNSFKPHLFIIDLNLRLKKNLLLNNLLKKRTTYLIINKDNVEKAKIFKKLGYKIILINSLKTESDFILLYKKIYKLGYSRVFVETGLTFLNTLVENNAIHDLYIFKSGNKLGKKGKNNASLKHLKKIRSKLITINLKDDKLYKKEFNNV
jgi:diaminohydroxyphosphoribosylaminopyrimidine deaminase / 5-amino-6-(5-phosphoribosylamino)uracil reductase